MRTICCLIINKLGIVVRRLVADLGKQLEFGERTFFVSQTKKLGVKILEILKNDVKVRILSFRLFNLGFN
jgi:hypothetical protein